MKYLEYNGMKYTIGTKVKINTYYYGEQIMILEQAYPTGLQFVGKNNYTIAVMANHNYIKEIIKPVYYEQSSDEVGRLYKCPPTWDVEIGWIWYIIIMVVGAIFKDRWIIWICASAFFFLWKYGMFYGGNKK